MGAFKELLDTGRTIILDAAMGTDLQSRGCDLSAPFWSSKPLFERPDVVRHIHIDNIDCGADIITTNTFRTQARTFEKAGFNLNGMSFEDTAKELTTTAVDLAKDAVMIAVEENEVLIAGCIAPLEDSYSPDIVPDTDELSAEHFRHIKNLVDAGVDLLIAETLTHTREISAVLDQLDKFELDYIISITPKDAEHLLSGEPLAEAISIIDKHSPAAISVNCVHPSLVEPAVNHIKTLTNIPLGAYANIGDPNFRSGDPMKQTVTPDAYLSYARRWKEIGARIIGGCCGTNPLYTRKLSTLKSEKKK